jgi:two-component system, NtrC family, sensor kinase
MRSLRRTTIFSFLAVISLLGILVFLLGYYVINSQIISRAQDQVGKDLKTAHAVFRQEITEMESAFSLIELLNNTTELKTKLRLDYLYVVDVSQKGSAPSELVQEAFKGNTIAWKRIIGEHELKGMNHQLYERSVIPIKPTPKARPTDRVELTSAMTIECAKPFFDSTGRVTHVLYGGRIINRYFDLVDRIRDIVYENNLYKSKPLGTVTIFQDDIRIATNVLNDKGERAIGTRVSDAVYTNVVEKGQVWRSRAFVVTDWYLTGYEPIKNIRGQIIGILYVGILEKQFIDMKRNLLSALLAIILFSMLIAGGVSFALAGTVSRPITDLLKATERLSAGDLTHRTTASAKVVELSRLLDSFDAMTRSLQERDESLRISNEKLDTLNKTYLDLVAMVSHELKGVLATAMLHAYSLRDETLGAINEKQKKALNSITRNLDYLDGTVKNFLNLSRIEKNELSLHSQRFGFKEDVVATALEAFHRQAAERAMTIECSIPDGLTVVGDVSLMQIVVNNLVSNAVKYGKDGGSIRLAARDNGHDFEFEIYNDGTPLSFEEIGRLFKRFVRLESSRRVQVRGTGIGLFITRQIIEKHGGSIRVEPRQAGNAFIFTLPSKTE